MRIGVACPVSTPLHARLSMMDHYGVLQSSRPAYYGQGGAPEPTPYARIVVAGVLAVLLVWYAGRTGTVVGAGWGSLALRVRRTFKGGASTWQPHWSPIGIGRPDQL